MQTKGLDRKTYLFEIWKIENILHKVVKGMADILIVDWRHELFSDEPSCLLSIAGIIRAERCSFLLSDFAYVLHVKDTFSKGKKQH
jgi:hypothetical protein